MKKAMSLFLAILMIFGVAAVGFTDLPVFTADAAETLQEGNYIYKIVDGEAIITRYTDWESTEALIIPETLGGYPVTGLDNGAFMSCRFTSVQLPSKLKTIHPEAFAYIGNNFEEISVAPGNGYFIVRDGALLNFNMDTLYLYPKNAPATTYTIPNSVIVIYYYAFFRALNLKEVIFPVWVRMIGDNAFYQSSVETIKFNGYDLFYLGNEAFGHSQINELDLPGDIEYFGWDAFIGTPFCRNKANYDEDGVLYFNNYLIATLADADKEYYEIKEGTIGIAGRAFEWDSLTEAVIPSSVCFLGANPFVLCENIKKITISPDNKYFTTDKHSVVYNLNKTKLMFYPVGIPNTCYVVPEGVTEIWHFAFHGSINLKNLYLPDTLIRTGVYPLGADTSNDSFNIYYEGSEEKWKNINISYDYNSAELCRTYTEEIHCNTYSDVEHDVINENDSGTICSCGYGYTDEEYEVIFSQYSAPFRYEIKNGEVTIKVCDISAEGVVEVPAEIDGYPVKHIGISAFGWCKLITEIILPDGIETIGGQAFANCELLAKINLPDSVKSIGREIFLNTLVEDSSSEYWTTVQVPDTVKRYYVLRVNNHIIEVKGSLPEVFEIPEGVISIADRAFTHARGECEVVIPSSLVSFERRTFSDSPIYSVEEASLRIFPDIVKFTVSEENPYYSNDVDGVLYNKDKTVLVRYPRGKADTEYTVANTVVEIADNAFSESCNLETVVMQEPLVTVGMYAFYNCESLLNFTLPDSVRRIKLYAFHGTLLYNKYSAGNFGPGILYVNNHVIDFFGLVEPESLEIKDGTITIADGGFGSTYHTIDFPDSLATIGDEAFSSRCSFANPLKISKNLTYIGDSAFKENVSVYAFDVDEENPEYSSDEYGVLYNKNKTKLIRYPNRSAWEEFTVPASVTEIAPYAFAGCKNLKSVKFESGSKTAYIDEKVFLDCVSLEKIEFPETVKEIKTYAFEGCENLNDVCFPENLERIMNWVFSDCDSLDNVTFKSNKIKIIQSLAFEFSGLEKIYFFGTEEEWAGVDTSDSEEISAAKVYCNWSDVTYGLDYYVDGSLYAEYIFPEGYATETPANPTKTGYNFVGWDAEIPENMPAKNLVLNAVFEPKEYTVTFQVDYSRIYKKTFRCDEPLSLPDEIDEHEINYWYKSSYKNPFDIDSATMPAENITLYAVLNKVQNSENYDVTAYHAGLAFGAGVTASLSVAEITGDRELGGVYMVDGDTYRQVGIFNIKAVDENGEVIQPQEGYSVTLKIAIPEAYKDRTDFVIYHRFVDGGREKLMTSDGTLTVDNGYLIFEVTSFSEFEILTRTASVSISKLPSKTRYIYKMEDIDLTGIKLKLTKADGTTTYITTPNLLTVSDFDNSRIGKQTVTVKYGQFSDTFEVEVVYTWWQILLRILTLGFLWG